MSNASKLTMFAALGAAGLMLSGDRQIPREREPVERTEAEQSAWDKKKARRKAAKAARKRNR